MRRDAFVHELIRHRQTPVVCLPFHVVVDDTDDPRQKSIGETLDKIVKDIPRLRYLMLYLLEAIFYGKYAGQIQWGQRKVSGNVWNSVINHMPINGDKLRYLWDGTPGIAIRTGAQDSFTDEENAFLNAYEDCIEYSMLGAALYLKKPFLRDRYVIHSFEGSDVDYLFEIEEQLSIKGLGLRSRLYWAWNLRIELLSWMVNALQRVGANGMLYGFYEEGNPQARDATLEALRMLVMENYSAFPLRGGTTDAKDMIQRIEPAPVGYDILLQLIQHLEGIMRRATLGQDLSSMSKPTGIGAGAAQLQGDVRADFIEYDAILLAETLTEQLLSTILKYNRFVYDGKIMYGDELPFSCRLEFQLTRENVAGVIQASQQLFQMGVELDADDLRRKAGLAPPRRKETTISNPQIRQQQQQAEASPGMKRSADRLDKVTKRMMNHAQSASMNGHNSPNRPSRGQRRDRLAGIK